MDGKQEAIYHAWKELVVFESLGNCNLFLKDYESSFEFPLSFFSNHGGLMMLFCICSNRHDRWIFI